MVETIIDPRIRLARLTSSKEIIIDEPCVAVVGVEVVVLYKRQLRGLIERYYAKTTILNHLIRTLY